MLRFLLFLIIFYIIFKGLKIFIRYISRGRQSKSYRNSNDRNVEEAEFTEIDSQIHTQDKDSTNGKQ